MQNGRVLEILREEIKKKMNEMRDDLIMASDYHGMVHLQERIKSLQFALDLVDWSEKKAIEE